MGGEKLGRGKEELMIRSVQHYQSNMIEAVFWHKQGTGSRLFAVDVTAGRTIRMNSEAYLTVLFAIIQPNVEKNRTVFQSLKTDRF